MRPDLTLVIRRCIFQMSHCHSEIRIGAAWVAVDAVGPVESTIILWLQRISPIGMHEHLIDLVGIEVGILHLCELAQPLHLELLWVALLAALLHFGSQVWLHGSLEPDSHQFRPTFPVLVENP